MLSRAGFASRWKGRNSKAQANCSKQTFIVLREACFSLSRCCCKFLATRANAEWISIDVTQICKQLHEVKPSEALQTNGTARATKLTKLKEPAITPVSNETLNRNVQKLHDDFPLTTSITRVLYSVICIIDLRMPFSKLHSAGDKTTETTWKISF